MERTKQQHYVPRAYLRFFSVNPFDENPKVYFYDKIANKTAITNVRNIAQERDFYTLDDQEDKDYWERFFSENVDGVLARELQKLNSKIALQNCNAQVITEDDKRNLALIISYQIVRTKNAMQFACMKAHEVMPPIISRYRDLARQLGRHELQVLLDAYTTDERKLKNLTLPVMLERERVQKFSSILESMLWTIYYNQSSFEFWTSDNPVVIYNFNDKRQGLGTVGFLEQFAFIVFPISPRAAIVLRHKTEYLVEAFFRYENKITLVPDLHVIEFINKLQFDGCNRFVFTSRAL